MARVSIKHQTTYILRESRETEEGWVPVDVYNLGPSPGAWIDYPGGNAWYVAPELEDKVAARAETYSPEELEALFWPFIHPEIRRATQAFRDRSQKTRFKRTSRKEKEALARATHPFDKRRAHFLKFGNMDQGPLVNLPAVLFKPFQKKSRDEIEQWFMAQESKMRPKELKSYVYTTFDLQRFFQGFMAKQMPHVLDQNRVEAYFLEEICRINQDLFGLDSHLHPYMVRYAVMFFDFSYEDTVLLEDLEQDFIFRHRFFKPPQKPAFSSARARGIFNLSKSDLRAMDKQTLTRKFRKLAREHHPDVGGDHDRFVEINDAYQTLLEKLKA